MLNTGRRKTTLSEEVSGNREIKFPRIMRANERKRKRENKDIVKQINWGKGIGAFV